MSDAGGSGGGDGGGGVLYKRIPPPPPEPQDYGPRLPTSPSYECYPEFGSTTDYAPADDGYNLNTLRLNDGHDNYDYLQDRDPNTYECGFGSMADHTPDGYGFKTPDCCSDGYDDYMDPSPKDSDDCTLTAAGVERQTNQYATAVLDHYNAQDQNQIKYELVQAITSAAIFSARGFYGHVNFTAKSNLENSKEEFLFAELYYDSDSDVYKPTCIVSLQGRERVGGVRGIESAGVYYGNGIPVDPQHCYACLEEVKHPKDGTLYESGHHVGGLYGYL